MLANEGVGQRSGASPVFASVVSQKKSKVRRSRSARKVSAAGAAVSAQLGRLAARARPAPCARTARRVSKLMMGVIVGAGPAFGTAGSRTSGSERVAHAQLELPHR